MLLSKLFEANTQTVFILDLPDPIKAKALAAFKALSDGQRHGDPEKLGGASLQNKGIHCSGLYAQVTEHVGDITHRMTEDFSRLHGLYGNCRDKVVMGIDRILGGDIERQVERNYEYRVDPERDKEAAKYSTQSSRFHGSMDQWKQFWRKSGKKYAEAHSKLPVWNEAQWHAREAAVNIGLMRFYVALKHLEALKARMKTQKDWTAYCGQITIDDQGNPVPYKPN